MPKKYLYWTSYPYQNNQNILSLYDTILKFDSRSMCMIYLHDVYSKNNYKVYLEDNIDSCILNQNDLKLGHFDDRHNENNFLFYKRD